MKSKIILLIILLSSLRIVAEAATAEEQNKYMDLQKSKWQEIYNLIDEIKVQNPPHHYSFQARLGLMQISSNSVDDPVKLGLGSNLPAVGINGSSNFLGNFGLEGRLIYAQNLVSDPDSVNKSSAAIYWFDFGPRYTFYLDSTRLDNNITLKVLYHVNDSTFKLTSNDLMFVTHYFGVSGSVERSIPITRKLGVVASLDLLQILSATSPSNKVLSPSGYGFEVHGEIYYLMELFQHPTRVGFSYWQQGNNNDFGDSAKGFFAKNSYFQLARALFLNATVLY